MPDKISLVSERPRTFWALMSFFLKKKVANFQTLKNLVKMKCDKNYLRCRRHIIGIMIQILMSFQQLFLPETLIASIALKGFLIGMDQHMGFQMPLADTRIRTQITLETFFSFMRLFVYFQSVAIRKGFSAHFAVQCAFGSMQFLHVQPQISFAAASRRT